MTTHPENRYSFRHSTAFEEGVVRKILAADEGLSRFAEQMSGAIVALIDEYGSICIRPVAKLSSEPLGPMRKLPAEAQAKDSDGVDVHFLLFEHDGWLCELQIYKDDGSPISREIRIEDLDVMVLK